MWEYSLKLRMLGPHQGIRLDRLRAELDDRFEAQNQTISSIEHEQYDQTQMVEQAMHMGKNPFQVLNQHNPKLPFRATQMARDTNGTQTVRKPHGIATKVRIQSGNVSKRKIIEPLTVSARTGI
jgi:hypothetical protein